MNSAELEHACISFWGKHLLSMPGPLPSCSWATVPFYNVKEDTNEVFLDRFLINYMVEADPDDILKNAYRLESAWLSLWESWHGQSP